MQLGLLGFDLGKRERELWQLVAASFGEEEGSPPFPLLHLYPS
jgi:hypothetical protein